MPKARKVKEISFSATNKVGLLLEVAAAIAEAKANITAICAYEMEKEGYFMLTTDGNSKAKKALARLGIGGIKEMDAVEVEAANKPGELQKIVKKIADAGIEVEYMYATAGGGRTATCIFRTSNDKKAIKVINKQK